jgi:hypothetical protein
MKSFIAYSIAVVLAIVLLYSNSPAAADTNITNAAVTVTNAPAVTTVAAVVPPVVKSNNTAEIHRPMAMFTVVSGIVAIVLYN